MESKQESTGLTYSILISPVKRAWNWMWPQSAPQATLALTKSTQIVRPVSIYQSKELAPGALKPLHVIYDNIYRQLGGNAKDYAPYVFIIVLMNMITRASGEMHTQYGQGDNNAWYKFVWNDEWTLFGEYITRGACWLTQTVTTPPTGVKFEAIPFANWTTWHGSTLIASATQQIGAAVTNRQRDCATQIYAVGQRMTTSYSESAYNALASWEGVAIALMVVTVITGGLLARKCYQTGTCKKLTNLCRRQDSNETVAILELEEGRGRWNLFGDEML